MQPGLLATLAAAPTGEGAAASLGSALRNALSFALALSTLVFAASFTLAFT